MAGVYFPGKPWPTWAREGGVGTADCAGVGFGAIRAGGFLPMEVAGGCKTVASTY